MSNDVVDEDFIRDELEKKINEAHREILGRHNIKTGDITPAEKKLVDDGIDELVEATRKWIKPSAKQPVFNSRFTSVFRKADGRLEIIDKKSQNKVEIKESVLEELELE